MVNRDGNLTLSDMPGHKVLGADGNPIQPRPRRHRLRGHQRHHHPRRQSRRPARRLRRRRTATSSPSRAAPSWPTPTAQQIKPIEATVRGEFIERSNVDPTTEMAELMDAQRQLEANANMIRYQDQTLQLLCNDVGKISEEWSLVSGHWSLSLSRVSAGGSARSRSMGMPTLPSDGRREEAARAASRQQGAPSDK